MSATEQNVTSVLLKKEPEWEGDIDIKTEYEVKSEVECSPERIQPQDIVTIPVLPTKIEVKLEAPTQTVTEEHDKEPNEDTETRLNVEKQSKQQQTQEKLICTHCYKIFESAEALKKHDTIKHNLTCDKCGKKFTKKENLAKHDFSHRIDHRKNCDCGNCVKGSTVPLQKHFTCDICLERFYNSFVLSVHMDAHLDKKPLFLKRRKLLKKEDILRRRREKRRERIQKQKETELLNEEDITVPSTKIEVPIELGDIKQEPIQTVKEEHDKEPIEDTQTSINVEKSKQKQEKMKLLCTHCNYCNKNFKNAASLKKHNKFKHKQPQNVFTCDICLKQFFNNYILSVHKKEHMDYGVATSSIK